MFTQHKSQYSEIIHEINLNYVPHLEKALEEHPILSVAQQVNITIGVPESILVLTVSNGFANSVAEYLSAQFYKEDIIFIPIGKHIICSSVYPVSALKKSNCVLGVEMKPEFFR